MLDVRALSVWLPGVGPTLDDINLACAPGQVWAVAGRSGSGASTLLGAVADRLPPGARVAGGVRWGTGPLRARDVVHIGPLPPLSVADYLRGLTDDVRLEAAAAGLDGHLGHRIATLPPDLRTALRLVALRHAAPTPVVLVDACLTAAGQPTRQLIVDEALRRARQGSVVLMADHDVATLRTVAHHVVELCRGRVVQTAEAATWRPSTLHRIARCGQIGRGRPAATIVVDPETVGLEGRGLEIGATEAVGLIDLAERPEPLARRIIELLGGAVVGSRVPRATRLERALHDPRPLWLPHPQAGLDPVDRASLAEGLSRTNAGPRLVTSRDHDFLSDACHRIVVVDRGRVVAVGAPRAVARCLRRPREAS